MNIKSINKKMNSININENNFLSKDFQLIFFVKDDYSHSLSLF